MANEWQPIATAPKDGRLLLLHPSRCWVSDAFGGDAEVGYWDEHFQEWVSDAASRAEDYAGPTHWMAIPDPPTEAERTE